ncbi:MAG TPA: hypothetical protein VMU54_13610 [Planctomycetota bacterium]|nr:hypothetical protein [Planctomycetota bacterium]
MIQFKANLSILVHAFVSLAFLAPGPIPAPWAETDIGAPGSAGSSTYDPATSTWVLQGGGADIWGTSDQFHYDYIPLTGDAIITAHVANLTDSTGGTTEDQWSKAGVMFRDGTAAGAMYAFECFTGNNGTDFQYRNSTGGGAANNGQTGGGAPHHWVRVARTGNSFQGSWSDDGITWTAHGAAQTIAMPAAANVGLAVCAHNNGTLSIATFDNVTITDGNGLFDWPLTPPANLTATAGYNQVTLNWAAVSGATSYQIFRSPTAAGPYNPPPLATVTAPTTTYVDGTAVFPNTYYYVVRAVSAIGTSVNSNEASCSPLQPTVIVAPTSLQVAENGGTATFTVSLRLNPTANVTVQCSSANAAALLLTAPGGTPQGTIQLTFTAGGVTTQQVTVTGVEQHLEGAPITVNITFTVTSTDVNYPPAVAPSPLPVTIIEDLPAIIINPPSGLSTVNGGPPITFTVQLATVPNGTVVLNLSVTDPNLATVAPLQITNAAWNNPVTVTVTPLNANTQTTYIAPYDIVVDSSASTDPAYAAIGQTLVPISTPVNLPPLTQVWGSKKCGLLGTELLLPLLGAGWWRRRRRSLHQPR